MPQRRVTARQGLAHGQAYQRHDLAHGQAYQRHGLAHGQAYQRHDLAHGQAYQRVGRLIGPAFVLAAVVMVPWMLLLAQELPTSTRAHNWSLAWIGFDLLMACGLAGSGILAWRRSRRLALTATATGTLLLVDAWFDVLTAGPGDLGQALLLAFCCELPVAVACLVVALHTSRRPRSVPAPSAEPVGPVGSGPGQ